MYSFSRCSFCQYFLRLRSIFLSYAINRFMKLYRFNGSKIEIESSSGALHRPVLNIKRCHPELSSWQSGGQRLRVKIIWWQNMEKLESIFEYYIEGLFLFIIAIVGVFGNLSFILIFSCSRKNLNTFHRYSFI